MAQIEKRGDKNYRIKVFRGRDENGKRMFVTETVRGTLKQAKEHAARLQVQVDTGTYQEPVHLTLSGYLDRWLETAAKPKLRERSFLDYQSLLKRYVRDRIGSKMLTDLRPLDVQKVYSEMGEQGLSPRVIRYTHAVLSSALKQAVRWDMIQRNPCDQVSLPKQSRREMTTLTPKEATKLIKALEGDRLAVLFSFALATGTRPEEYLALRWSDVDLVKGTATIQRALVRRGNSGKYSFEEPKTSKSRRTIPLPASLVSALSAHRPTQLAERLKLGAVWTDLDLIFCSEIGTPLSLQNISRRHFKPALKRAELPNVRLYDLRHTCATLLLAADENPKVVVERLGHSTIVLTLDTYTHVLPDMQAAASEKLEKMLFAG